MVERSAVNRLVVGSNPTWGDLIHSELTNSGLTLTVKSREPVPCLCFYLLLGYKVGLCWNKLIDGCLFLLLLVGWLKYVLIMIISG